MVSLPYFPELAGNPGQEGGPKVCHSMWSCTWDGGIRQPQISSCSPLAEQGGSVGVSRGRGRVLPALELGSDSGQPQEAREKDAAAPAGAGQTALW